MPRSDKVGHLQRSLLLALLPTAVVLAVAAVAAGAAGVPVGSLVRDTAVTAGQPAHTGALSAACIMFWAAAAGIALTASRHDPLLRDLGLLTVLLALDDQYQLHEHVLPSAGIPDLVVYAAYGAAAGYIAVRHRARLLSDAALPVLLLGAVLLAASVGIDVVEPALPDALRPPEGVRVYAEDGSKLCGAALWLYYVVVRARRGA